MRLIWQVGVLALASLTLKAGEEAQALSVIGTYAEAASAIDPNLYRMVIRNDSEKPLTIKYLSTLIEGESPRSIGSDDPDVCWWRAMPPVLPAGGYGEIRIKMDRSGATLPSVRIQSAEGAHVSAALPAERPVLSIRSIRYDSSEQSYVVYWTSSKYGVNPLTQVFLDGKVISPSATDADKLVAAGQVRCLTIKLKEPVQVGTFHLISLRTEKEAADCLFRAPAPFYLGIESSGVEVFSQKKIACDVNALIGNSVQKTAESLRTSTCLVASCLTHRPALPRANVWTMLRAQRQIWQKDALQNTVIHLCRLDLEEGAAMFGQAVDGIRVNAYPYEVPGSETHDFSEARKILEDARASAGTGNVHAVIPVDSANDDRILPRTLLAISAGCSGVLYRLPDHKDPDDLKKIAAHIQDELQPVRETMPLWDCVETVSPVISKDTSVGGWLVQMGPRRLAVILLASSITPVGKSNVISFNLPEGAVAQRVLTFDGKELSKLQGNEKRLELTLDRFKGGTVIFIELAKPAANAYEF